MLCSIANTTQQNEYEDLKIETGSLDSKILRVVVFEWWITGSFGVFFVWFYFFLFFQMYRD